MWEVVRYLTVGVANTLVGVAVIFALMLMGVGPVISNIVGYGAGFLLGFALNRRFTFRSNRPVRDALIPYLAVFLFAYGASLATLTIGIWHFELDPYAAQGASVLLYTVLSFLGFRRFAFFRTTP